MRFPATEPFAGAEGPAWRGRDIGALALLVALYLVTVPFAITHHDLARDVSVALSIVRGERFPMEGPLLAGRIHLGPLWYYLLAMPLAITPSWMAAVGWTAALGALQIPLAYAVGARLVDRRAGLVFAALLLLPGWTTFETVFPLTTTLVPACTLAFVYAILRFDATGTPVALGAAGLSYALALHAHPSTIGIGVLLLWVVAKRHRNAPVRPAAYAWLALGATLPFLPYAVSQVLTGFPDWARAADYLSDAAAIGSVSAVPPLIHSMLTTGPEVIADGFLARLPAARSIGVGIVVALWALGFAGIAIALVRGERRRLIGVAAGVFGVVVVSVAALRAATPFYMVFAASTLAAGLLALGIRSLLGIPVARFAAIAGVAIAVTWTAVIQLAVADTLSRGAYRFAFFPLFDVKRPLADALAAPVLPAYAMASSGLRLCASRALVAHGSYAFHLLHDFAVEARLACGRTSGIALGGAAGNPADAWVGVSRVIAAAVPLTVHDWLGPIGLVPAVQVINPVTGAQVPSPTQYPPVALTFGAGAHHVVEFDADREEAVLVTNVFFAFNGDPTLVVAANGARVDALARDRVSAAYACGACAGDRRVRWRLEIATSALERVDIVTIAMRKPS